MSNKDNLGELIKAAMRAEKITQDGLAEKMGVSRQTINNHLSRRRIDRDFLLQLKELTGIDFVNYYEQENLDSNSGIPHPPPANLTEYLLMDKLTYMQKELETLKREIGKLKDKNVKE